MRLIGCAVCQAYVPPCMRSFAGIPWIPSLGIPGTFRLLKIIKRKVVFDPTRIACNDDHDLSTASRKTWVPSPAHLTQSSSHPSQGKCQRLGESILQVELSGGPGG
jgi:hypothetical protein